MDLRRRTLVSLLVLASLACGGDEPLGPGAGDPPDLAPAGDVQAPELRDVAFSPTRVTVLNRAKTVTVTVRVTDEGDGVSSVIVHFRGPSSASITGLATLSLVEGTPTDGVFRGPFEVPAFAEEGEWILNLVRLEDRAGNVSQFNEPALRAMGISVVLRVLHGR